MQTAKSLDVAAAASKQARALLTADRALLIAVSGIDASGKGFLTDRLAVRLQEEGIRAEVVHADGWLNLPSKRFSRENPGEHFYEHGFRFDEMFAQLIEPLREQRSVSIEADYTEETASQYRRHRYEFHDVDVILLEAIFLFKRAYQGRYDLSFWIDCTFETAMERAIARAQEGLSAAETARAHETIFFPAQRIHFDRDEPRVGPIILPNDPRLG
jgi:uridine kinase